MKKDDLPETWFRAEHAIEILPSFFRKSTTLTAQKMANTNAKEHGDPDPFLEDFKSLRLHARRLGEGLRKLNTEIEKTLEYLNSAMPETGLEDKNR